MNSLLAGFISVFMTVEAWLGFSHTPAPQPVVPSTSALGSTEAPASPAAPAASATDSSQPSLSTQSGQNTSLPKTLSSGTATSTSTQTSSVSTTLPTGSPWLSVLPLGDNKYVTSGPKKGYVYLCHLSSGGGGAQEDGPWIKGNEWYPNQKTNVEGAISWPNAMVNISVSGALRTILSNGLPVGGTTGSFPIAASDPAHQYDANPNSVEAQNQSFSIPANPTEASAPGCIYGEVGVMTNGVLLNDAFDELYRDAAAHEIQDSCDGHPHEGGVYHYHSLSSCIKDIDETNIIGWAFDGFPITGPKLPSGKYLTTNDLDECHGITSPIVENGKTVTTYHYVMTEDFPYSVGCFRGKSYEPKPGGGSGGGGSTSSGSSSTSGSGTTSSQPGSQQSGPPQEAITACASHTSGDTCTVSTSNGDISGTCKTPPNSSSLACIPTNR